MLIVLRVMPASCPRGSRRMSWTSQRLRGLSLATSTTPARPRCNDVQILLFLTYVLSEGSLRLAGGLCRLFVNYGSPLSFGSIV